MVTAIRVYQHGGPEVLQVETIDLPPPSSGEARVRHTAIGVNYIDTYFRSGLYAAPNGLPLIPGNEAAGVVEAVGDGVTLVKPGDRVVYLFGPGAYISERNVPIDKLLPIPDRISDEVAAAVLLKGLTAQYLLRRTFEIGPQHSLLFHAAAGGVGLIAGQWAKHLGAKTIGTAGSKAKVELALANGFDHVINYTEANFVAETLAITSGEKLDVVYDSVGKTTFPASLDVLKPLGLFVTFGQSSGPIPPVDLGILNTKGSLYVTRPSLFAYHTTRDSLVAASSELFALIEQGILKIAVNQRFALRDVHLAHEALEGAPLPVLQF